MNIAGFHVDGFGVFHDLERLDLPSRGLTVIEGDNEAGKSTLVAFLRAILFGFADGRARENAYPPQALAAHGGTVTLVDARGERYLVERYRDKRGGRATLTLPDGKAGGDDDLKRLLGQATRDLYRNVFAFSLDELQRLDVLSDEHVRATIYSAGAGTGGVSVATIDRELESAQSKLFKPGAASLPLINQKAEELRQLRAELDKVACNLGEFDRLQAQLATLSARIEALEARGQQLEANQTAAQRLLDAHEDWLALRDATEELRQTPAVDAFPADGPALLADVEARLRGSEEKLAALAAERREEQAKRQAIVVDAAVLGQAEVIEWLVRGREHFDSAIHDQPLRRAELQTAQEGLADGLRELGAEWDLARVEAWDTSLAERELIAVRREALAAAATQLDHAEQRLDLARQALQGPSVAATQAREELATLAEPAEKDEAALGERLRGLRRLGGLLRDLQVARERAGFGKERETALAREAQRLRRVPAAGALPALLPWAALLAGLALAVALLALGTPVGAALALGVGLLAAFAVARLRAAQIRQNAEQVSAEAARLAEVEGERAQAAEQAALAQAGLAKLQAETQTLCRQASAPESIDEAGVLDLAAALEAAREALRQWRTAEAEDRRAQRQLAAAQAAVEDAQVAWEKARSELACCQAEWSRWLAGAGLRADLSPTGALQIVDACGRCRERARDVAARQQRLEQIETFLAEYTTRTRAAAASCDLAAGEEIGAQADALAARLTLARRQRDACLALEERLATLVLQQAVEEERRQAAAAELARLLFTGGAADAAEFRARAAAWQRRQELAQLCAQHSRALERLAGGGEHLAAFQRALAEMAPDEQRRLVAEAAAALPGLRQELDEGRDKRGALRQQLRALEEEQQSPTLRAREQSLRAEVQAAAREWAVYALARALLAEATERYERERQPGVIKEAGVFFQRITRERYTRIVAAPEEKFSLQVLDAAGHRKELSALSRGTQEQLYLAVRLGLIREFARRQEPLPVMMDDIAVNFDPQRAEAALGTVLELAESHQVLLFTCHPETSAQVRRLAPEAAILRLRQGELVAGC
ncbi:MAG: AAA family ATPase [Chloroflexota bacterium]